MIPIIIGTVGTVTKEWVQGLEDLEIRGRVESPGNLRLAVTQTPVENHLPMLVWKTQRVK